MPSAHVCGKPVCPGARSHSPRYQGASRCHDSFRVQPERAFPGAPRPEGWPKEGVREKSSFWGLGRLRRQRRREWVLGAGPCPLPSTPCCPCRAQPGPPPSTPGQASPLSDGTVGGCRLLPCGPQGRGEGAPPSFWGRPVPRPLARPCKPRFRAPWKRLLAEWARETAS